MSQTIERIKKRRIIKRHPAEVLVYLKKLVGYEKCKTKDISRGGVFIMTTCKEFAVPDTVEMIFVQQQGATNVFRIRRYATQAVHQHPHGLGFKFKVPQKN